VRIFQNAGCFCLSPASCNSFYSLRQGGAEGSSSASSFRELPLRVSLSGMRESYSRYREIWSASDIGSNGLAITSVAPDCLEMCDLMRHCTLAVNEWRRQRANPAAHAVAATWPDHPMPGIITSRRKGRAITTNSVQGFLTGKRKLLARSLPRPPEQTGR